VGAVEGADLEKQASQILRGKQAIPKDFLGIWQTLLPGEKPPMLLPNSPRSATKNPDGSDTIKTVPDAVPNGKEPR